VEILHLGDLAASSFLVVLAASSFLVDLAAYQVVLEACLAFLVVVAFPY
jgi:hypothetical protein